MSSVVAALVAAVSMVAARPAAHAMPPIKHVFTIVLENENADTTFGPSSGAPFLAGPLKAAGAFVPNYFGIGHASLDNYVALASGQAPNPATQADCPIFADFIGSFTPGSSGGQAVGAGCVYPAGVQTIGSQLQAKGLTWRSYGEDMGNSPPAPAACRHPDVNGQDSTQAQRPNDAFAGRHVPFIYFHSVIDDASNCAAHVVDLKALPADLSTATGTPNYVFITPNLCHDGHDSTCQQREKGGLPGIDEFLSTWIPRITGSPAYRDGGLINIIFDESGSDDAACCAEMPGPDSPLPGQGGPGGGRTGAVLISPFIAPGTVVSTAYNHYSLLRTEEDIFGLSHLGFAGADGLTTFGSDVFTRPQGLTPPPSTHRVKRCRTVRVTKRVRRHGRLRKIKVKRRRCHFVTRPGRLPRQ